MPIAHPPRVIGDTLPVKIPSATALTPIYSGQPVAMIQSSGSTVLVPCGARVADHTEQFVGFSYLDMSIGASRPIITGRGSRVEPLVEGGGTLVPDEMVYLALTPGYVTQTPPQGSGIVNTPIGHAVSETEMILKTDARVFFP
jgi:hypothetical protein